MTAQLLKAKLKTHPTVKLKVTQHTTQTGRTARETDGEIEGKRKAIAREKRRETLLLLALDFSVIRNVYVPALHLNI